jgi:hypothetical protein
LKQLFNLAMQRVNLLKNSSDPRRVVLQILVYVDDLVDTEALLQQPVGNNRAVQEVGQFFGALCRSNVTRPGTHDQLSKLKL